MKKTLGVIVLILVIGSLVACSDNNSNTKSNSIYAADLNEREDFILFTTTSNSFVFDFNSSDYQEVTLWVEKYEDGELADDKIGSMTAQVGESGSIVLATEKANDKEEQLTFYSGVAGENGTSSSYSVSDENLKDGDYSSAVYGDLPGEKTLDDGEIVLANIAYSNNEFGMSSISNRFFEDPEGHMNELKEYSVVYLFKVSFME